MRWLVRLVVVLTLLLVQALCCQAQPKAKPKGSKSSESATTELPLNKPIDLLELVNLQDHVIRGNWKRIDGGITCEAGPDALFFVPVAVLGNYQLNFEFTRRTGNEHVSITFPVGLTSETLVMSAWGGAASGLHRVGGVEAKNLPLNSGAVVKPGKLANGQRYAVQIEVSQVNDRVTIAAEVDGKRFIHWKGLAAQLSCWASFSVPCPQSIGFVVHQSVADIHKAELTLKKGGKGVQLDGFAKNPLDLVANAPPKQIADKCLTWNDRKYFISDKPMNFAEAQRLAAQVQGRLVTISSPEEESFILKEGRGVYLWMAGWRNLGGNVWRDDSLRPLNYQGQWAGRQPSRGYWETQLGIFTTNSVGRGWDDNSPINAAHACIEWGEE